MNILEKKKAAAKKSTEYIKDHMILGLGAGTTVFHMIEEVGALVKQGLKLKVIVNSDVTFALARERNIPLIPIDAVDMIDLVIDGVDQIDSDFNAIKGAGGSLFREKVVAKAAKEIIWIMDDSKLVDRIGTIPLPVAIIPYGYKFVIRELENKGYHPILRRDQNEIYMTDNHNYIVDVMINNGINIYDVEQQLRNITGVVEIGLFLNMCNRIVIGTEVGAKAIENRNAVNKPMVLTSQGISWVSL